MSRRSRLGGVCCDRVRFGSVSQGGRGSVAYVKVGQGTAVEARSVAFAV